MICGKLQNLEVLEIWDAEHCSVERYDGFGQLKRLRKLFINNFSISHGLFKEVHEQLEELDFLMHERDANFLNSDEFLNVLRNCCPNLQNLTVPEDFHVMAKNLLNHLNLESLVVSSYNYNPLKNVTSWDQCCIYYRDGIEE